MVWPPRPRTRRTAINRAAREALRLMPKDGNLKRLLCNSALIEADPSGSSSRTSVPKGDHLA
jgi:hypothetical protein